MNNSETDTESEEYNNMNSINDLSTDSEDNNSTIQNTINGGENDIEIMKKLVNMCVKYENDLIKINEVKKTLTDKLKKTKAALAPFMEKKEIDFINVNPQMGGGKIKYNKTKVYKSLSKKTLINLFNAYFGSEEKTKEIIKFLYDNREYKEVSKITKTKK
jgi:hypothetical protein|tara:strand:- start:2253 stop:2732 length:480 start_codon:yes stop_codon:yes gene_type:complete